MTPLPETAKTPETLRALADIFEGHVRLRKITVDGVRFYDYLRSHADAWQADRQMRQEYFLEVIRLDDVARPLEAELEVAKAREEAYSELVMAVETKHEGETRHQTALRYIREAEHRPSSGPFVTASEPPGARHAMPLMQSREGINPVERLMADASEPPGTARPSLGEEGT